MEAVVHLELRLMGAEENSSPLKWEVEVLGVPSSHSKLEAERFPATPVVSVVWISSLGKLRHNQNADQGW